LGRKDRERFLRLRESDSDYVGFRGRHRSGSPEAENVTAKPPPPATETVVCSVCGRKRNVASDSLPEDIAAYVCLRCQEEADTG